jgi:hypothetical protein
MLTVMTLAPSEQLDAMPRPVVRASVRSPDDWRAELQGHGERLVVVRRGAHLAVESGAGGHTDLPLLVGPDVTEPRAAIQRAFREAAGKYPRYRDIGPYRWRATWILIAWTILAAWFLPHVVTAALARRRRRMTASARAVTYGMWATGASWMIFWYLR